MDIIEFLIQAWQVSEGQGNDGQAATTPDPANPKGLCVIISLPARRNATQYFPKPQLRQSAELFGS